MMKASGGKGIGLVQDMFVFFPAALFVHGLAEEHLGERTRIAAILAVSLVFYGAWDPRFLALLGASILVNYSIGSLLETATDQGSATKADRLLLAGVSVNLLVLGYFKYAHLYRRRDGLRARRHHPAAGDIQKWTRKMLGWTAPDGICCARMSC
jgi:D-alanyl-lipoteichoic acid acyltransferase DltB (MBOAT superfamily)